MIWMLAVAYAVGVIVIMPIPHILLDGNDYRTQWYRALLWPLWVPTRLCIEVGRHAAPAMREARRAMLGKGDDAS